MDQIHLDYLGKSAKVVFKRLPPAQAEPPIVEKTSLGPVTPLKAINGVNTWLDPQTLTPEMLIKNDPELALDRAGLVLDPESLSTAYIDSADTARVPVANFTQIDIVFDPIGQEKERRALGGNENEVVIERVEDDVAYVEPWTVVEERL